MFTTFSSKYNENDINGIFDSSIEILVICIFHLLARTGVGVGMTRDTSTLMVAQYFKRKREFVEIFVIAASGVGLATLSVLINGAIR